MIIKNAVNLTFNDTEQKINVSASAGVKICLANLAKDQNFL